MDANTVIQAISFLSTLSLRRATIGLQNRKKRHNNFYPRSPCGERPPITLRHCTTYLFLSTLSLRRATVNEIPYQREIYHFYPRSPCGERRLAVGAQQGFFVISIHALLAESDQGADFGHKMIRISIHALLAESD